MLTIIYRSFWIAVSAAVYRTFWAALLATSVLLLPDSAWADLQGITANTFNLTARVGLVSTPDGNSVVIWGLADDSGAGLAQYPGPTLIVQEGDLVTVNLRNDLANPVSLVFPGMVGVTAAGGTPGLLTREAPPDGTTTVIYSFVASHSGTYQYHSGTWPELQVEMGLVGALVVRPTGFDPMSPTAYNHPDSAYDVEYLFLLSEMDPMIHFLAEIYGADALQGLDLFSSYMATYWFINGRAAPDTMLGPDVPWLPYQPYNAMPMMHPGERLLMRVVGGGRDLHPFHHHGNHARVIARDGRLLESTPGAGPDLGIQVFTVQSAPGQTVDAIFEWTGKDLGWDIYGTGPDFAHDCMDMDTDGYDDMTREYCADHGKPFPVVLPNKQDLMFGNYWSGSPYLGLMGSLPPGSGGFNPMGGYTYMWHSHNEKEMTNYDIFPGGMMTMLMIMPPGSHMTM